MKINTVRVAVGVLGLGLASCVGTIEDDLKTDPEEGAGGSGGSSVAGKPGPAGTFYQQSALRRLSKDELRNTIVDLTGGYSPDIPTLDQLPEEPKPFDNDYGRQFASRSLVEAFKRIAYNVADAVVDDDNRRKLVVGCTTTDAACTKQFITTFGRRVFRRPLSEPEVTELAGLANVQLDFNTGLKVLLRTMLQDPEFLYRIERGTSVGGADLVQLNGWEMASRLSYLLAGTMPNDQLFDMAARGQLDSSEGVHRAASAILSGSSPFGGQAWVKRVHDRVNRFHSMWLGYEYSLSSSPISAKMRVETNALLERVIFETPKPWTELFLSKESFVDASLVSHYGDKMSPAGSFPQWTSYGASKRQGILSHGAFLSVANAPADTSVTLRGKNLRSRLLCEEIMILSAEELKKLNGGVAVDTTQPPVPAANECRIDAIKRTTLRPGSACIGCHNRMDPIGLGLENYDRAGKYRANDAGKPSCTISGQGFLEDATKPFVGPAGLSKMLVETQAGALASCVTRQFLRFASGREIRADESSFLEATVKGFQDGQLRFDQLLLAYVSSPGFGYRRIE